jgi:hypothetical protein
MSCTAVDCCPKATVKTLLLPLLIQHFGFTLYEQKKVMQAWKFLISLTQLGIQISVHHKTLPLPKVHPKTLHCMLILTKSPSFYSPSLSNLKA